MTAAARFLGYEVDADGHVYQALAVGGRRVDLYPVLDPISLEHAFEVGRTILPAIVALFERDPGRDGFAQFHRFFERFARIRRGEGAALEGLDEIEARVLDALHASINDRTPEDEIHRRAFACFYQHGICDNDVYRAKARGSLERLVTCLAEMHAER